MSLRNDLLSMVERWACTDGRPPNEAENERRKCARELEQYVRRNVPPESAPPAPSAVETTPDPFFDPPSEQELRAIDEAVAAQRRVPCAECSGTGLACGGANPVRCDACDGLGDIPRAAVETTPCDDHRPDGPDPYPDCKCAEIDHLCNRPNRAAVAPTDEGARTCSGCSHFAAKGEPTGAGICDAFPMNDPTHGTVHALAYGFEYVDGCDRFAPRGGQGGKTP